MSIKLRFDKGSLSTQVTLTDDALPALLQIISEHQSDEVGVLSAQTKSAPASDGSGDQQGADAGKITFVKSQLCQHSAAEVLGQVDFEKFPEKIMLFGAFHESTGGGEGWRSSDIENQFKAAREQPPSNFARDISSAIKSGLVAPVTPRTYKVSKTGWVKLYESIVNATAKNAQPQS